jgi:hypothetical protein
VECAEMALRAEIADEVERVGEPFGLMIGAEVGRLGLLLICEGIEECVLG